MNSPVLIIRAQRHHEVIDSEDVRLFRKGYNVPHRLDGTDERHQITFALKSYKSCPGAVSHANIFPNGLHIAAVCKGLVAKGPHLIRPAMWVGY